MGGTPLVACDLRRATRDAEAVAGLVREIRHIDSDDGVSFDLDRLEHPKQLIVLDSDLVASDRCVQQQPGQPCSRAPISAA